MKASSKKGKENKTKVGLKRKLRNSLKNDKSLKRKKLA